MTHSTTSRHSTPVGNTRIRQAFGRMDDRTGRTIGRPIDEERSGYYPEEFSDEQRCSATPLNEIEREELEFLAQFIQGTAFYAESLEEYLGEPLEDFWQAREHAYHIVTTYLILNMSAA